MIRLLAKWRAKRNYVWKLLIEGETSDINAALAARNAQAKRELSQKLTADADAIEENIRKVDVQLDKGYWLCEDGHEMENQPPTKPSDEKFNGITIAKPTCECGKPAKEIRRDLMTGQEKYESEKERKEAEQVAVEKRKQAAEEEKGAADGEGVVKYHRTIAENARQTAEKIKSL
jgi:hypothetical protein